MQERAVVQVPIGTEDNLSPNGDRLLHVITKVRSQRADHHHARNDNVELTGCNESKREPTGHRMLETFTIFVSSAILLMCTTLELSFTFDKSPEAGCYQQRRKTRGTPPVSTETQLF